MMSDADTQGPMFSAAWEPYRGRPRPRSARQRARHAEEVRLDRRRGCFSFSITGNAKVEGNFTDITMSGISRNTCMNLTGVVDYFFDYLVLPRSAQPTSTRGATGCPAAETYCSDSVDNDGNGFADCIDNNCIITSATPAETWPASRRRTHPGDSTRPLTRRRQARRTRCTNVEIDNVYVTRDCQVRTSGSRRRSPRRRTEASTCSAAAAAAEWACSRREGNVIGKIRRSRRRRRRPKSCPSNLLAVNLVTAAGTLPTASTQTPATRP